MKRFFVRISFAFLNSVILYLAVLLISNLLDLNVDMAVSYFALGAIGSLVAIEQLKNTKWN